jgi:uncharacterized protein YegJ (DUF2314 family)
MKTLTYTFFLLLCCVASVAGQTKVENNWKYKAVGLVKDDPTFLALKDTAQKHIAVFIQGVQKNGMAITNYRFIVKSDFVENGHHEHMWSQVYMYNDHSFKGVFIDSPFKLKNIKTGDKVTIKDLEIEDWVIFDLKTEKKTGDFSAKYLDNQH